jgi:hypothetical protein
MLRLGQPPRSGHGTSFLGGTCTDQAFPVKLCGAKIRFRKGDLSFQIPKELKPIHARTPDLTLSVDEAVFAAAKAAASVAASVAVSVAV